MNTLIEKSPPVEGCPGQEKPPCVRACSAWNRHLSTPVLTKASETGSLPAVLAQPYLCDVLTMRIAAHLSRNTG